VDEQARIVAIETSGRHGSVAVAAGAVLLAQRELPPTMRHAAELMPAIRDLTQAQGWPPEQIDQVYLSLGPGSFTGLRIAVAIARALAQAVGCKLVGVLSLDVIAHNAPAACDIVLPVLDAKRGQVFAARYERDAQGVLRQAAAAALVDPAAFVQQAILRAGERAQEMSSMLKVSPATITVALLGEGVDYHRDALFAAAGNLPERTQLIELDRALWPGRAATVHQLGYAAALAGQFSDPATLLPFYIRLPEAEEVYRKKHGIPL
jgi:tRNA threonylcarbamoyladenosine biosynthesis protein TsaB